MDNLDYSDFSFKSFLYTGSPLKKATLGSAGYDLISTKSVQVEPGRIATVNTGVKVKPPYDYYFEVFIRSSWGKKGLSLANGTGIIDSDYRGEILLIIRNNTNEVITIQEGERIAQMIPKRNEQIFATLCTEEDFQIQVSKEKGYNMRGEGGFGSTGNK